MNSHTNGRKTRTARCGNQATMSPTRSGDCIAMRFGSRSANSTNSPVTSTKENAETDAACEPAEARAPEQFGDARTDQRLAHDAAQHGHGVETDLQRGDDPAAVAPECEEPDRPGIAFVGEDAHAGLARGGEGNLGHRDHHADSDQREDDERSRRVDSWRKPSRQAGLSRPMARNFSRRRAFSVGAVERQQRRQRRLHRRAHRVHGCVAAPDARRRAARG